MRRPLIAATTVLLLTLGGTPAYAAERTRVQLPAEDFSFSPGAGRPTSRQLVLWSTGSATTYVDTAAAMGSLDFTAVAQQCEGAPHLQVAVDGVTRLTQEVDGVGSYRVRIDWAGGRHKVTFRFLDDHRTADRLPDRRRLLEDGDPMAALGSVDRTCEAGRAGSDHGDPFGPVPDAGNGKPAFLA